MSRRQDDAKRVIDAIEWYIQARFGISPHRHPAYSNDADQCIKAEEELEKAIMQATGNPEPE